MLTTEELDARIRVLVTELMNSAPQAPSLLELESVHPSQVNAGASRARRPVHRARWVSLAGIGALAIAALLVAVLLPSVGQKQPVAAASQLRLIATAAAQQPMSQLASNQWLETQQEVSYSYSVTQVGTEKVSGATASVAGGIDQWSNNFGESCWTATIGDATFASPTNEAAWKRIGLATTPSHSKNGSCGAVSGDNVSNGKSGGVISVASLPTDPTTLAHELLTGTTGLACACEQADPSSGFVLAAEILLGPTIGLTPALTAAVYEALALMPHVQELGQVVTHSGATGLGFTTPSPDGPRTIVVEPDTGQLLELRNITSMVPDMAMDVGISQSYTRSLGSYGSDGELQWIDPIGSPAVVGAVPSTLAGELPTITAQITATAKPGVAPASMEALEAQLSAQFSFSSGQDPNGGGYMDINFAGPRSQVPAFVAAIQASGLFASVVVSNGPG